MRPLWIAASLVAAMCLGAPDLLAAQKPRRSPSAAPAQEASPPPPPSSAPREVAVPREAAAPRDVAPKSSPRSETMRGEGTPLAAAPAPSVSEDQNKRPGAVRRPPDGGSGSGGQATPPRDHAVARRGPPPRDYDDDYYYRGYPRGGRVYYYPSYYSYGRYYAPYYYGGFHLGYLAYSPWGWTPAFYGYPYGYGYGYGYGYPSYAYDFGRVRIKVKPRDAEVYVDGYFAGMVDDFDGTFQSLRLETGGYKIEIRKPGFETLVFDVHVQPDRTITYRGEMRVRP
jgi:hypothetical protein